MAAVGAAVLSIGEVLIDLIALDGSRGLEDARSLAVRPGGAPANVAVALARLGVPVAFAGAVGVDPFGRRLRAVLAAEGVDVSRLRSVEDEDTSLAFAWKDARGDGHFRFLRMADRLISPDDVLAAGIEDAAAVVVGSVALTVEPSRSAVAAAAEKAARTAVPLCFDVNMRPTLWSSQTEARRASEPIAARSTLLKLSLDDARFLFGVADDPLTAFRAAQSFTPGQVVLTDGGRGSWYTPPGAAEPVHLPAFEVEAVEPTGAGDAFGAGLIARLISKDWAPLDEADLRFAAGAGALATTRPGAMDGLPTMAELVAFLEAH